MKKFWILLIVAIFLTACGGQETMETVSDIYDIQAMSQLRRLDLQLPEDAVVESMENDNAGVIYFCDGYTLTVQMAESGDLDRTLRQTTGFGRDQLTVMQTLQEDVKRYDCVWSAVGEGGDQIGRAAVLDDGGYHYVVTVMADASVAGELTPIWQDILGSAKIVNTD